MPFKINITTIKPEGSTALWPFESDRPDLNQDKTNEHEVWASQQPGFIDRTSSWITPGFVYEKIYIFDTRENAEAFLEARKTEETHSARRQYFNENGFVSTKTIWEI